MIRHDPGRLQVRRSRSSACGLILALALSGCTDRPPEHPVHGFRPVPARLDLGDDARFELAPIRIVSDGRRRLLVGYEKSDRASGERLGAFFRISTDGGASFGPERTMPDALLTGIDSLAFTKGGLAAAYPSLAGKVNIYYMPSDDGGATWSEPVQVNDEQDSARSGGTGVSMLQSSKNDVYCLWIDLRHGFPLTFFSSSRDGGRTWSPNQPVEFDFREGVQQSPKLVAGADGRLLAFWADGRDRQTLFDIRSSYSDDGGRSWSPSERVNDDRERAWQYSPAAVAGGNRIYTVFTDFREPGEEGDNDWNLYFAASTDNGRTWRRNLRLNDVRSGEDAAPVLTIAEHGTLYCVWQSNRASIFGDIYFAYSTDGGRSWSPSIKVNGEGDLMLRRPIDMVALSGGKALCLWGESQPGRLTGHLSWLEPLGAQAPSGAPATPDAERGSLQPGPEDGGSSASARAHSSRELALLEGRAIFADDFSGGDLAHWRTTGTWTVIEGSAMGVEPGQRVPYASFARIEEPERYLLRGRFKLDPVHHQMAYLYVRASPGAHRAYIIANGFRTGTSLSLKEKDSPPLLFGPFALEGRPLLQRRFPFRSGRWYEFALAVTPEGLEYHVDGNRMLSYRARLALPRGAVGIGGFGSAPTYFDDIVVRDLRPQ